MIHDFLYLVLKAKIHPFLTDIDLFEYDQSKDVRTGKLTKPHSLFVGFEPFECLDFQDNIQRCAVIANFRLVTENKREGDERVRHDSAGHIALQREIFIHTQPITQGRLSEIPEFTSLAGTEDDFHILNSITRVGGDTDHSGNAKITSTQQFRIVYFDYSACKDFQKVTADFEITDLLLS